MNFLFIIVAFLVAAAFSLRNRFRFKHKKRAMQPFFTPKQLGPFCGVLRNARDSVTQNAINGRLVPSKKFGRSALTVLLKDSGINSEDVEITGISSAVAAGHVMADRPGFVSIAFTDSIFKTNIVKLATTAIVEADTDEWPMQIERLAHKKD